MERIEPFDVYRILMGTTPVTFLFETIFRTIIMYLVLLVTLRLLGKRMNGQMSLVELAVMLVLGAIVSVPMQAADRGIVPGTVLLITILLLQRGLNFLSFKSKDVQNVIVGEPKLLLKDGVIQTNEMSGNGISYGQMCAHLRAANVTQLGEVERAYLEPNGKFSVFLRKEAQDGLSILPEADKDLLERQQKARDKKACRQCGYVLFKNDQTTDCPQCENNKWTNAAAAV
jgi:uncharacterized membrane protein YcaP (DUF421 family)